MAKNDHYSTLGVARDASEKEIKAAYRKLAMKYHPDRNQGDTAASKKFTNAANAYEILSDAKKRKEYDTFGDANTPGSRPNGSSRSGGQSRGFSDGGFSEGSFSGGGFESQFGGFEDIFSQFTSGQGNARTSRERESPEPESVAPSLDVEVTKQIHLFDFLLGTKVTVETVYSKQLTLTIKPGTQPGTKFKIS